MNTRYKFSWYLLFMLMQGCSTAPISQTVATSPPSNRIYKESSYEGSSSITVIRDKGFAGSGCGVNVSVDNLLYAKLLQAEMIKIPVEPGNHFIQAEMKGALCPAIIVSQETIIENGQSRSYRISLPTTGVMNLTRID